MCIRKFSESRTSIFILNPFQFRSIPHLSTIQVNADNPTPPLQMHLIPLRANNCLKYSPEQDVLYIRLLHVPIVGCNIISREDGSTLAQCAISDTPGEDREREKEGWHNHKHSIMCYKLTVSVDSHLKGCR